LAGAGSHRKRAGRVGLEDRTVENQPVGHRMRARRIYGPLFLHRAAAGIVKRLGDICIPARGQAAGLVVAQRGANIARVGLADQLIGCGVQIEKNSRRVSWPVPPFPCETFPIACGALWDRHKRLSVLPR
jgi:hypothetical protein